MKILVITHIGDDHAYHSSDRNPHPDLSWKVGKHLGSLIFLFAVLLLPWLFGLIGEDLTL